MNLPHHTKLPLSMALTTLLLTGCGGGSDSNPDVFTKCNAFGAHNADAPSSYRLFPLLAEGVELLPIPEAAPLLSREPIIKATF